MAAAVVALLIWLPTKEVSSLALARGLALLRILDLIIVSFPSPENKRCHSAVRLLIDFFFFFFLVPD